MKLRSPIKINRFRGQIIQIKFSFWILFSASFLFISDCLPKVVLRKLKLRPNTLESLVWGLLNFDGIETDIRFNKDSEIVIYHDSKMKWKPINKMSNSMCKEKNIPLLRDFLSHQAVQRANNDNKHFIFELKPDCEWYKESTDVSVFRDKLIRTFEESNFVIRDNIHFMSFSKPMLSAFKVTNFKVYPIFPLSNFCVYKNRWSYLLWKPIYFMFKHTTTEVLEYAKDNGFTGAYLSFTYFYVMNKIYKETHAQILEFVKKHNLQLIGNFYFDRFEIKNENIITLVDRTQNYPRYSTTGGPLIGHKGCGANSVKIPLNEYEELMKIVNHI